MMKIIAGLIKGSISLAMWIQLQNRHSVVFFPV